MFKSDPLPTSRRFVNLVGKSSCLKTRVLTRPTRERYKERVFQNIEELKIFLKIGELVKQIIY